MSTELNPELLKKAYTNGYFPMCDQGEIYWYNPDPRAILPLGGFIKSRSLRRSIKNRGYKVRFDTSFEKIIDCCADRKETWIDENIKSAYIEQFRIGVAHCVEVWSDENLVGGLYGLVYGGGFFAESMFHKKTDASKVALSALVDHLNEKGFELLEVQFLTPHLKSLGVVEISQLEYFKKLQHALLKEVAF